LLGVTRQAYYHYFRQEFVERCQEEIIIKEVNRLREKLPKLGTRKLYFLLTNFLQQHRIKLGRDQLFEVLGANNLLIRKKKKNKPQTTNSNHWFRRYPNLIATLIANRPNQVWVSDITYIEVGNGFSYLFLITDAYSRKIIGYCLAESLEAKWAVKALKMAIKQRTSKEPTIHHSDRGIQYCSWEYVDQLNQLQIQISMTQNSDPRDNAIAERVNGILKDELLIKNYPSLHQAQEHLSRVIQIYNEERPHSSINFLTPQQAHLHEGYIKRRWKTYMRKTYNKNENLENVQL
jgi:putative transposase